MTETTLRTPTAGLQRKRARLERELRALHMMDGSLRTRELFWAVLTIPGVALLVLGVAAKAHWLSQSPLIAIIAATATGLLVWWIGRRWLGLALLIVLGLFLILLEDVPDTGWDSASKGKERRRIKLERAIARRETLLAQLGGHRP
jgi:Zn-dependent protease with chaperone function